MFSFLGFYGKLCVFSLDRGIGECGIEKKKKKEGEIVQNDEEKKVARQNQNRKTFGLTFAYLV